VQNHKLTGQKGWINYQQLPIVLRTDDADKAIFATQIRGKKAIIKQAKTDEKIPHQYRMFADVFSDKELKYPPKRP
jgi:hypothetical protein